jgi:3-hydroxyisobutyrate dehydrogenase
MVSARKAVIYLGGDAEAAKKVEPVIKGFADLCLYFGPFGARDQGQADQQHAGSPSTSRRTAEAMALGLKAGVDIDLMIKAVATAAAARPSSASARRGWRSAASSRCRAAGPAASLFRT